MRMKSLTESKKLKYGTLNIILIAIVIAIAILLNTIVSVLSSSFGWYIDMTEEQLYTVSDELVELLEDISEDTEIDIIFCSDKDKIEGNYIDASTNTGSALAYVHSTATQISDRLSNVNVLYKNPIKDHEFMRNFTSGISPSESTVIIARKDANGGYGTMYRVYHATSFYTFTSEVDGSNTLYGYSGERTFASAIISLTHDKTPTAYFVTGHGEDVPYSLESGDYNIPELARVYLDCGFRVRYIYLTADEKQFTCPVEGCGETWGKKEIGSSKSFDCECGKTYRTYEVEFNEERVIPSDARTIIINNPKSDIDDKEYNKLVEYLRDQKGTIMCFVDPILMKEDSQKFATLNDLIKIQTGVTIGTSDYVTHGGTSTQGQTYDFKGVVADNAAASAYLSVLQNFGSKQPMFKNSGILTIDPAYLKDEPFGARLEDKVTMPILQTANDAKYGDEEGAFNIMTVTALTTDEGVYSYFVVCPSVEFAGDKYLSNSMYTNEDVLLGLIHSTTAANVPVDMDFKEFANYQLDISSSQATTTFVCLVTILPCLVVALGVIIIVRRKRR